MAVSLRVFFQIAVLLAVTFHSFGLPTKSGTKVAATSPEDLSDAELMTGEEEEDSDDGEELEDSSTEGQHLFPSFSSLFGGGGLTHSRQFYSEFTAPPRSFNTEPSFHHSPVAASGRSLYTSAEETDRVLGSGNFGVIRGGTYYGGGGGSADEPYTRGVNAHGRPYRRPNPPPQYKLGGDFFSGFRDFADITTPTKSAYSNIYVVYANRNATSADSNGSRPKNIRELIEAGQREEEEDLAEDQEEEEAPSKSKTKKKLALYKQKQALRESAKKFRSKGVDPLLALS